MKTKRLILMLFVAFVTSSAMSQKLKMVKFMSSRNNPIGKIGLTMVNKPNGTMYRLREEIQVDYLKPSPRTRSLKQIITGKTDYGHFALYRKDLGATDYSFIVTLYDEKDDMYAEIDLNEVSDNYDCELQAIRYEKERLYYNFACPSYSSGLNGQCSSLYCFDIAKNKVIWKTPYLTSNDIFVIHGNYIICGYGFTGEKDYVFLVNKETGKVLSKVLIKSSPQYIEVKNGHIFVVDYNDNVYDFVIANK